MIKLSNLKLLNFSFFKKYEKQIIAKNITYVSEIEFLSLLQINDIFGTGFNEGRKILAFIDEIKTHIEKNAINEIYLESKTSDTNYKNDNNELEIDEKVEECYEIPISKLGLSVRSTNCLVNNGYLYVSEILNLNGIELHKIRNMGNKSVEEIMSFIKKYRQTPAAYDDLKENVLENESDIAYNDDTSIEDLNLSIRSYNCLINAGYKKLGEIRVLTKEQLFEIRNMGRKSVEEIMSILEGYSFSEQRLDVLTLKKRFEECCSIVDSFKYKDYLLIKFCEFIESDQLHNIIMKIDSSLIVSNLTFKDLLLYINNTNISTIEYNDIILIYNFFNYYLNDENYKFDLNLDEKTLYIIKERKNGKSLKVLGDEYGITRERIRQLESKGVMKIERFFKKYDIHKFLLDDIYTKNNNTILSDELYEIVFNYLGEFNECIKIDINNTLYYVTKRHYEYINNIFLGIKNDILWQGVVFKTEVDLSSIDSRIIKHFFDINKISISEMGYYIGEKLYERLLSYLKRYKTINLKDSNCDFIKQELYRVVGLDDFDKHNIVAALTRKGEVVPSGDSNYVLISHIPTIDDGLLSEIKDKIVEIKVADSNYLYQLYKSKIPNIYTPTILYSILKEKFSDEFNYGGANLVISISEMSPSKAGNVYDELLKSDQPIANIDLMSKFNLDKTSLAVIDGQNDDVFYLDDVFLWLYSKMKFLEYIVTQFKSYIVRNQSFYLADMYRYMESIAKDKMTIDNITTFERFHRLLKLRCADELKNFTYDRFKKLYTRNKIIEVASGFDLDF